MWLVPMRTYATDLLSFGIYTKYWKSIVQWWQILMRSLTLAKMRMYNHIEKSYIPASDLT